MRDWRDLAECKNSDPDLFFPDSTGKGALDAARAICAICPVKRPCLDFALSEYIEFGMWGGMSREERKDIRMSRGDRKPRQVRDMQPEGTFAAVKRHERRREPMCDKCAPVKNALSKIQRENRKRRRIAARATERRNTDDRSRSA